MASLKMFHLLIFLSVLCFKLLSSVRSDEVTQNEEMNADDMDQNNLTAEDLENFGKEFNEEEAKKLFEEEINAFLKELGFENKETLTVENYKQLLNKYLTRDQPVPDEEKELFENLVAKMMEDLPESIPVSDLGRYLDVGKMSRIINELTGGQIPNFNMEGQTENNQSQDAGDENNGENPERSEL